MIHIIYNVQLVHCSPYNTKKSSMFMWICNYKLIGQDVWLSAPGGTLSDEVTSTEVCLFKAQEDMETMQAYAQVSACKSLPRNKCSLGVCAKPCLIFRFLTNSSGATSIWRKILKKRLKRCVSCTFVGKWEVLKTIMCNFIQPERRGWFFFFSFWICSCCCFSRASQSQSAPSWPC